MSEEVITSSPSKVKKLAKKSPELGNSENLPAIWEDLASGVETKLNQIQKQIDSISDRQKSGVSAEFNALMDGYVNKANESQSYKVKFEHLDGLYEELNLEHKTFREEVKKSRADLEASKEALRMSESDLQRAKRDLDNNRLQYEEQISNLIEEREKLKAKVKQLMDHKEKSSQEYNDLKAELLENKYRVKQLEQEKQVEVETQRRTARETNKIIEDLKEKLDLRTREVEYKDALLNQLIKQVSADDAMHDAGNYVNYSNPEPNWQESITASPSGLNDNRNNQKSGMELRLEDPNEGSSWGAFRK
jgi:chromosome segregation ATPase